MKMVLSLLNGEETEVPDILLKNESIFKSVVNLDVWESLTVDEKDHLLTFIPAANGSENFKEDTVKAVLSDDKDFKFGNPVQSMFEKLKSGLLSPSVVELKENCKSLKFRNYKLKQKEYYKNLLQEIITSRQSVLDKAYRHGPHKVKLKRRPPPVILQQNAREKVKRKYEKIIKDVRTECGDDVASSDEDIEVTSKHDVSNPSKVGNDSSINSKLTVTNPNDVTPDDLSLMLDQHRRKRLLCETHPELDTTNISLADVIMRCNSIKKTGKGKNKKLKKKKLKGKKKLHSSVKPIEQKENIKVSKNPIKPIKEVEKTPEKVKEVVKTSVFQGYPDFASFFSLLGYFFENEEGKTSNMAVIKEKLAAWQRHKSSEACGWKTLYPNWLPLLSYAIEYMVGEGTSSLLHDFIPLLISNKEYEWTWSGPDHYNDDVIPPYCNHWLDTLSQVMTVEEDVEDKDKKTIDTTRTAYVVATSTPEEKMQFRKQEKERYENPHHPYIYTTHGYQSIVGPVKGVFNSKHLSASKAREHAMLVSERPAYVTILCLVRDAVARLPNGEGTRTNVCTLLKDSQFLNPNATDSQVHGVVSGALDRLHAEKDPCVKFDPIRKLWIYLHRTRSMEEFEKLHEASAAAALAKKQLTQSKQKAVKQKKVVPEVTEPPPEKVSKPKKESTPKVKKNTPIKSDTTPTKQIKEEIIEETPLTVQQPIIPMPNEVPKPINHPKPVPDEQKKKPIKRKRSVVDPVVPKLPKLHEFEASVSDIGDELQLSLENEALMATQSILSDEEASDIFGDKQGHSDFLDIDSFTAPGDGLPSPTPVSTSFELESSLANDASFSMDMLQGSDLAETVVNADGGSSIDAFIADFQSVDNLKPSITSNHLRVEPPPLSNINPSDFSLQNHPSASLQNSSHQNITQQNNSSRQPSAKQFSFSQIPDVLGDKSFGSYGGNDAIMLSSLKVLGAAANTNATNQQNMSVNPQSLPTNQQNVAANQQGMIVNQQNLLGSQAFNTNNTTLHLQANQQSLPTLLPTPQNNTMLQQQHHALMSQPFHEPAEFVAAQTQQALNVTSDYSEENKSNYLKQHTQIQQMLAQQQHQQQQQQLQQLQQKQQQQLQQQQQQHQQQQQQQQQHHQQQQHQQQLQQQQQLQEHQMKQKQQEQQQQKKQLQQQHLQQQKQPQKLQQQQMQQQQVLQQQSLQQQKQPQKSPQQQQQQQSISTPKTAKTTKQTSRKERTTQSKAKNVQQNSPQNMQLPPGMRMQITQSNAGIRMQVPQASAGMRIQVPQGTGKAKYVQPQLGLNFSNMMGTSVQTLSQFITSKASQASKSNIAANTVSLTSPVSTISFNNVTTTSSRLPTPNVNSNASSISAVSNQSSQPQVQQQLSGSIPGTGRDDSEVTRAINFQSFTTTQGNASQFRLQGSGTTGLPTGQLADVKGCRGNQIITGQPPASLVNQKINLVPKSATLSNSTPVQTFSLNQLMAVAGARGVQPNVSNAQKLHAVPIPVSQVMQSPNAAASSPVTSIQALLQVVPKIGNNTHVLIQRQVPNNGDQNISKVVRLPKSFGQANQASATRPVQNSTLTFQKVDNVAGHILGQHALATHILGQHALVTGQKNTQKTNSPPVAPLKISLPRANFSGLPSSVSLASTGQPVRFSNSANMAPKLQSPIETNFLNADVLSKLQTNPQDKGSS